MESFPTLDTLNIFEDSKEHFEKSLLQIQSNNIFIRKFFQELILSPYGGSDFQGGVQMELNGRI